jgi:hypothetical protein
VLQLGAALVHHAVAARRDDRVQPHHRLAAHLVHVPAAVRDHPVHRRRTRSPNVELIGCQSARQWSSFPFAADRCPCAEKLRTVLPFTVGIRDGVVQLVSILGSVVTG